MYSTASNFAVEPWRVCQYIDWEQKYGAWLQAQHGFQRRTITNSYSYPSHYLSIVEWDSRATARAALTGVGHEEYMAANSIEGVIMPTRPTEAF